MYQIQDIDPNFAQQSVENEQLCFYDTKKPPFVQYGLQSSSPGEPFCRMPTQIAFNISHKTGNLSRHTSGGRIRFQSDSDIFTLRVTQREQTPFFSHMTGLAMSGFDLYEYKAGCQRYLGSFLPPKDRKNGYTASLQLSKREMRDLILYFPLYDWVAGLFIGVRKDAFIGSGGTYTFCRPVAFYGSSITQGGCASRPGLSYPAKLSRLLDMDYLNLGFSGNAFGEIEMAEYLASLDVAAYVIAYDHNAPNPAFLERTHYAFYRKIRQLRPNTPIVLCTSASGDWDEKERMERREIIRQSYTTARQSGDQFIWLVDGSCLFPDDAGDCTVDGCHPNDLGFAYLTEALLPCLQEILCIKELSSRAEQK